MEPYSNEQILKSLRQAPKPVQQAFGSKHSEAVVLSLRDKYRLAVDVTGALNSEVGYLLLGLINPVGFLQRVQSLGIDAATANNIVQDVNREIFIPLQQKMREVSEDEDDEVDDWHEEPSVTVVPPSEPLVPVMQVGVPPQNAPIYSQPPTPVASSINLIQPAAPTAQPVAPEVIPTFVPTPPQQTVAPAPHEMLVHPRTMREDVATMGQGGIVPANLPGVVRQAPVSVGQGSPARAFQTSSIPNTAHDVPEQVSMPRPITPSVPLRDTFASIPPQPRPEVAAAPSTKDYRVDPYRELPQ